jgi:hypothetical protein
MAGDIRNGGQKMELRANQWEQCIFFNNPVVLEGARFATGEEYRGKRNVK